LRVDPAAWHAALAVRPDLAGIPHLADWAGQGRPVIVRRFLPGEAPDRVPVALPLPPANGKLRIAMLLRTEAVSPLPPLSLAAAQDAAPASWRPVLAALVALGVAHGATPLVFGSLLWQRLTGLPYLGPDSDLDLLWKLPGRIPARLLAGMAAIEADAPMRLDGEIVLDDGAGINWRELHAGLPEILAKTVAGVSLRNADDLRAPERAA